MIGFPNMLYFSDLPNDCIFTAFDFLSPLNIIKVRTATKSLMELIKIYVLEHASNMRKYELSLYWHTEGTHIKKFSHSKATIHYHLKYAIEFNKPKIFMCLIQAVASKLRYSNNIRIDIKMCIDWRPDIEDMLLGLNRKIGEHFHYKIDVVRYEKYIHDGKLLQVKISLYH